MLAEPLPMSSGAIVTVCDGIAGDERVICVLDKSPALPAMMQKADG
jgi:hypothetical protein